jgi:hypothetical protein
MGGTFMGFALVARQQALDGITVDRVSLHSGDPGTTGASYITAGGKQAASFNAANASGERVLNADVAFTGMTPSQSVTYFGVWLNSGDVFKCGAILTGDQAANAAGEYTLKGTTTKITA